MESGLARSTSLRPERPGDAAVGASGTTTRRKVLADPAGCWGWKLLRELLCASRNSQRRLGRAPVLAALSTRQRSLRLEWGHAPTAAGGGCTACARLDHA